MSQFCVYISPPGYLRDWLINEYWNPETARIEFPRGSAPRAVLKSLLRTQPKRYLDSSASSDLLAVEVPTFKGVNPATFNYLSPHAKAALIASCKDLFQSVMFQELNPLFTHNVQITNIVYDFMDRHGIEPSERNWEAIRQMYYRLRKKTFKDKG